MPIIPEQYLHKNHVELAQVDLLLLQQLCIRRCLDHQTNNVLPYSCSPQHARHQYTLQTNHYKAKINALLHLADAI